MSAAADFQKGSRPAGAQISFQVDGRTLRVRGGGNVLEACLDNVGQTGQIRTCATSIWQSHQSELEPFFNCAAPAMATSADCIEAIGCAIDDVGYTNAYNACLDAQWAAWEDCPVCDR